MPDVADHGKIRLHGLAALTPLFFWERGRG
jgi:hypothetical protein